MAEGAGEDMALVPGCKHDIFVSYAHVDNIDELDAGRGWVSEFINFVGLLLKSRLANGDRLNIYFDQRALGGNHDLDTLLSAAQESAVFLAIASTAYKNRDWPQRELAAFCEGCDYSQRLFIAEYLPLADGERFDEPLASRKRNALWMTDPDTGVNSPLLFGTPAYRARAHQLADQLAAQLTKMEREGGAAPGKKPAETAARQAAGEDAARDASQARTLVVGKTAGDMEDDAQRAKTYFEQLGYHVIDAGDLRQGGADFRADFQSAIGQAELVMLPVGASPGRRPPDLPEGYYEAQFDLAEQAGVKTIAWRRPTVSAQSAGDEAHARTLSRSAVMASTYEGFITEVDSALAQKARDEDSGGPEDPMQGLMFIHADKGDRAAAVKLQEQLAAMGIDAAVPIFEGTASEIREDLFEYMTKSDTVLLLYGDVGLRWVRAQLMALSKLRPKMSARIKAVCIGPPADKPKDLGFKANDLEIIDVMPDWSHEPIIKLVKASA